MKKLTLFLVIFILSSSINAQIFQVPESAVYDSNSNRYFVSNFGDGNIIQIDSTGEKTLFKQGLAKSLGTIILNNTLYVVTNTKMVKGFDLDNGELTFDIQIDEAVFLNDITSDGAGFLYVTDSNGNVLYKIDIEKRTYIKLLETELKSPNGIIYDKFNNRLVFCYFKENSQVDAISLKDGAHTTLYLTGFDNLDGIAQDESGDFYISSWDASSFSTGFNKTGKIYKFDNSFKNAPIVISTDLYGPADISYAKDKQELLIPLFLGNDVIFKSLKQ